VKKDGRVRKLKIEKADDEFKTTELKSEKALIGAGGEVCV